MHRNDKVKRRRFGEEKRISSYEKSKYITTKVRLPDKRREDQHNG